MQEPEPVTEPIPEPVVAGPPRPRADDDLLNPHGGDYSWPALSAVDIQLLGPARSEAWELRWQDLEQQAEFHAPPRQDMDFYLAAN